MPERGGHVQYEAVAASQTDNKLGDAGVGSYLERIIVTVATAATGTVSIKDGSGTSAIPLTAANTAIGVYTVWIGAYAVTAANPGWFVTTGAGATVLAVGKFTA